jgi:hypothetical protein
MASVPSTSAKSESSIVPRKSKTAHEVLKSLNENTKKTRQTLVRIATSLIEQIRKRKNENTI